MQVFRYAFLCFLLCWNVLPNPVLKLNIPAHRGSVTRLGVSSQTGMILSGSPDGTVCLWDSIGNHVKSFFPPLFAPGKMLYSCTISPDGLIGAVALSGPKPEVAWSTLELFTVASGKSLWRTELPGVVCDLEFSPDGRLLAAGMGNGGGIAVFNTGSGAEIKRLSGFSGSVFSLDFSVSGKIVAAWSTGEIVVYNGEYMEEGIYYSAPGKVPCSVAFSPDAALIGVGYEGRGGIVVLDAFTMEIKDSIQLTGTVVLDWEEDTELKAFCSGAHSYLITWSEESKWKSQHVREISAYDLKLSGNGSIVAGGRKGIVGYDNEGKELFFIDNIILDFSGLVPGSFALSCDDSRITLEFKGLPPLLFSIVEGVLIRADFLEREKRRNRREIMVPLNLQKKGKIFSSVEADSLILVGIGNTLYCCNERGKILWNLPLGCPVLALAAGKEACAAALADGTIRWIDLKSGMERLSLFIRKDFREWAMWTPEGRWVTSEGGENLLCWAFRGEFSFQERVLGVEKINRDKQGILSVEKSKKANIRILSPADCDTIRDTIAVLALRSEDTGTGPVTSISVEVNGISRPTIFRGILPRKERSVRYVHVQLDPGYNFILVRAFTGGREVWTGNLSLFSYLRESTGKEWKKPRLHALLVGVSNYSDPALCLLYASKDAVDMSMELFRQKGGLYRDVNIKVLSDSSATRESIIEGFQKLSREAEPSDVTMIFLAGHGFYGQDRRAYFVPFDGDTSRLRRTCIPFSELKHCSEKIGGKKLLFLDACYSGAVIPGARALPIDIRQASDELFSARPGIYIFSSSTASQISREDPLWKNGAFSRALLEALRGKADYNRNGIISAGMIELYVSGRVKELTGGKQTPLACKSPGMSDFPFAVTNSRGTGIW